jgi:hypothetical protein
MKTGSWPRKGKRLIALLTVLGIGLLLVLVMRSYITQPVQLMTWQDFQGVYYLGDGLGIIWDLTIQPEQKFLLHMGSDLGVVAEYTGTIVIINGQVLLSTPENGRWMPQTAVPVQWGQRHYLVLKEDIADFCEWRSEGLEPRKSILGNIAYLRMNDWELPAEGQPITLDGIPLCR